MFPEGHVHDEREGEIYSLLSTNLGLSTIRSTSIFQLVISTSITIFSKFALSRISKTLKACITGTLISAMLLFAAVNDSTARPELMSWGRGMS